MMQTVASEIERSWRKKLEWCFFRTMKLALGTVDFNWFAKYFNLIGIAIWSETLNEISFQFLFLATQTKDREVESALDVYYLKFFNMNDPAISLTTNSQMKLHTSRSVFVIH